MLRALYEREIKPGLIVATSAGAINGAFVASRPQAVKTADEPRKPRLSGAFLRGERRDSNPRPPGPQAAVGLGRAAGLFRSRTGLTTPPSGIEVAADWAGWCAIGSGQALPIRTGVLDDAGVTPRRTAGLPDCGLS
jgi:hypothetical protein